MRADRRRRRSPVDRLVLGLAAVAVGLVALGLLTRFLAYRREVADPGIAVPGWMLLFDVGAEANVPTWFTVVVMVAGAVGALGAAILCWGGCRRSAWFFAALAVLLLAMSLDEVASLHERLQGLGESLIGGSAVHFAWVLPGTLIAGAIMAGLALGARAISAATRRRLLVALGTFFTGALAIELIGGQLFDAQGDRAVYVLLVISVEEFLEMLGVILVLRAVLRSIHAAPHGAGWVLRPAGAA